MKRLILIVTLVLFAAQPAYAADKYVFILKAIGNAYWLTLKQGIESVNSSQQNASALADAWERGASGVDLARVMIESQKASVSFRALTEVRNRLVTVYQDIMNMSI